MRTTSNHSRDHRGKTKMVFSVEEKIIIKNYLDEFGLSAYEIWKLHEETKGWKYRSIKRLVNRYKEYGSMDRRKGAGRPRTVNTEENAELVEELICSQEDEPHTHLTPRQIESTEDISRSSVVRIVNEQGIDNFKRNKTTAISEGTRKKTG